MQLPSRRTLREEDEASISAFLDRSLETERGEIEKWHQVWVDATDLDPMGDSRLAAVWKMSGRCIGLARALLYLAAGGFCIECIPLARALHEAHRLVDAFTEPEGERLVRQWLAGKSIKPGTVRQALEAAEERLGEMAREGGG